MVSFLPCFTFRETLSYITFSIADPRGSVTVAAVAVAITDAVAGCKPTPSPFLSSHQTSKAVTSRSLACSTALLKYAACSLPSFIHFAAALYFSLVSLSSSIVSLDLASRSSSRASTARSSSVMCPCLSSPPFLFVGKVFLVGQGHHNTRGRTCWREHSLTHRLRLHPPPSRRRGRARQT